MQSGKGVRKMPEPGKFAIVFERSEDGYGAFVPELPGCITVGDTLQETEQNIQEANRRPHRGYASARRKDCIMRF